jgi:hypothetical protein
MDAWDHPEMDTFFDDKVRGHSNIALLDAFWNIHLSWNLLLLGLGLARFDRTKQHDTQTMASKASQFT